ncbi:MAG: cation:proton antiporter [Planctomycetota bacterium]|jgi:Kef-type K+ transport system membrane component KefB|nr:cation:proton antiporter [Planctomycetota bacterium]
MDRSTLHAHALKRRALPWGDWFGLLAAVGVLWVVSLVDLVQPSHSATLLLLPGLLLVAGALAGRCATQIGLPRLTGYIVLGTLVGPAVLQLVTEDQVKVIKSVNELAIGLIAMMAGAEIRLSWLRSRLAAVVVCALAKAAVTPLAVLVVLLLVPGIFPFWDGLDAAGGPAWVPALMIGFVVMASSPMVVVSVIKETRSAGPLSEMAMGLAVFKDVVVILGFTVLLALTKGLAESTGDDTSATQIFSVGGTALFHIALSVALGVPIGWGLAWLSEREYPRLAWALVGVSLVVALLAPSLHIKPLFCLLAAGFTCENMWPRRSAWGSHHLEGALGRVSAPVFVVFFVAAGLGLHLDMLRDAWLAVVVLVAVRMASFWASLEIGCRLTGVEPVARRYLWLGMVPQAGVTLGLAAIIESSFGDWGIELAGLLVACVAIHELAGPVALTWVLKRAGEAKV